MHLPSISSLSISSLSISSLSISLLLLLSPLPTTAILVVETSTSTYTALPTTSTSPSTSPSSSSTPASAQYTSTPLFLSSILNSTNLYRAHYNATPLTWNASLASYAAAYAQKCNFSHSGGAPGENLAEGYDDVTDAVDAWGGEARRFDYRGGGGFKESTGHFSQLVWKDTSTVGCGRWECDGSGGDKGGKARGWFVVCEYWPRGNVEGRFGDEVGRSVGGWRSENEGAVGSQVAKLAESVNGAAGVRGVGFGLGGWVVVAMAVVVGVGMGV